MKNKSVGNSFGENYSAECSASGAPECEEPTANDGFFPTHSSSEPELCVLPWAHGGTVMLSKRDSNWVHGDQKRAGVNVGSQKRIA